MRPRAACYVALGVASLTAFVTASAQTACITGNCMLGTGDLGNPTTRYYLVRNKQTNEP
jgi:hypothetical protein